MADKNNITLMEKIIDVRGAFAKKFGYFPNTIIVGEKMYDDLCTELKERYDYHTTSGECHPVMVLGMEVLVSRKPDAFKCIHLIEEN